MVKARVVLLT